MSRPRISSKTFIVILLSILLILNLVLIAKEVGSFGLGILRDLDRDGLWRSARFAYSANFADYIDFLRQEIPEDSLVVIPPKEISTWYLGDTPTMQFFLAPREITNCLTIECGSSLMDREDTYLLVMGLDRFPGSEVRSDPDRLRMHNDTWGVFGDFSDPAKSDNQQITGLSWAIKEILWFIFVLFLIGLLAWSAGVILAPNLSTGFRLSLGIGLLLGYYSIGSYLFLITSIISDLSLIFYLLTVVALLVMVYCGWRKKRLLKEFLPFIAPNKDFDWGVLVLAGLGGLFTYLSIGSGFHETDSIVLWGAKAVGILRDGLPGVISHGTNTTFYPLHIPLLLSTFLDLFGFLLPGAKVIFPMYYFALLLVVYAFLRNRMGWVASLLSAMILGTVTIVIRHGMIAYANLPLTFYIVAGVVFFKIASEDLSENWNWLISGVLFCLAAWTRPEGIWLVLGISVVLFGYLLLNKSMNLDRRSILLILPCLILYAVWTLTRRAFYLLPEPIESTLAILSREFAVKSYHIGDLLEILGYLGKGLFNFEFWGIVGFGLMFSAVLILIRKRSRIQSGDLYLSTVVIIALITAIYYILSFDTNTEIYWWVTSGYYRMIMPGMVLAWMGLVLDINSPAREGGAAGQ